MQTKNISFSGIPVSKYKVKQGNSKSCEIVIYELEQKDKEFLQKLKNKAREKSLISENIQKPNIYHDKKIYINFCYGLIKDSIQDILNIFKIKDNSKIKDPSIKYLAAVNGKPCGILMGNIPKIAPDLSQIVYSNRNKLRETELDWMITWRPHGEEKTTGVGKAIISEYFNAASKLNSADNIYVRSSIPMVANAVDFYKSNGFRKTAHDFIEYEHASRPRDLTSLLNSKKFKNSNLSVCPLEISIDEAVNSFKKTERQLKRKSIKNKSVNLLDVLDI